MKAKIFYIQRAKKGGENENDPTCTIRPVSYLEFAEALVQLHPTELRSETTEKVGGEEIRGFGRHIERGLETRQPTYHLRAITQHLGELFRVCR